MISQSREDKRRRKKSHPPPKFVFAYYYFLSVVVSYTLAVKESVIGRFADADPVTTSTTSPVVTTSSWSCLVWLYIGLSYFLLQVCVCVDFVCVVGLLYWNQQICIYKSLVSLLCLKGIIRKRPKRKSSK